MAPAFAYVLHWSALTGRGDNVGRLIVHLRETGRLLSGSANGGTVRVITDPDPDMADAAVVRRLISPDASTLPALADIDPFRPATAWTLTAEEHAGLKSGMTNSLLVRQVSNALKHHLALSDVAQTSGDADDRAWRVIVEDDACTLHNPAHIAEALRDVPDDVDMLMLGLPAPALVPVREDDARFPPLATHFRSLPQCDSYAVRVGVARRMAAAFLPIRFPTHTHLWWLMRTLGVRVHTSPNVMLVDGSKFGLFVSSIDVNNRLWLNAAYCDLEAAIAACERSSSDASWPPAASAATSASTSSGPNPPHQPSCAGVSTSSSSAAAATPRVSIREPSPADALTALTALALRMPFREHPDMLHLLAKVEMLCGRHVEAEAMFKTALVAYTRAGSVLNDRSRFLIDHIAVYRAGVCEVPTRVDPVI